MYESHVLNDLALLGVTGVIVERVEVEDCVHVYSVDVCVWCGRVCVMWVYTVNFLNNRHFGTKGSVLY